jgi:protein-S-isoprenylcysteine O-methyltransferase Ste14
MPSKIRTWKTEVARRVSWEYDVAQIPMPAKWISTNFGCAAALAYVLAMLGLFLWLAGDWHWMRGWMFYAAIAAFSGMCLLWMRLKDPALLAERLRRPGSGGESRADLAILLGMKVSGLAWWVLPPLGVRFGWTPHLPLWCAGCGGILFIGGAFFFFRAFTDNTFVSQLVRIQSERGHRVVDTGVYRFVRHPMYLGASLMCVGGALFLGSVPALVVSIGMILLLVVRILGEEKLLASDLGGYPAYREKVRFRLVPGLW